MADKEEETYKRAVAMRDRWRKSRGGKGFIVGCADLAQYAWCDEYSRLLCFENEPVMFLSMLEDYLFYNKGLSFNGEEELLDYVEGMPDDEALFFLSKVGIYDGDWKSYLLPRPPVSVEDDQGKEIVAELLPSVRWTFNYRDKGLYVVCCPEGIDLKEDACYEFGLTGSEYLRKYRTAVKSMQADIGAYLYGLSNIRVDVYSTSEEEKEDERRKVKERPVDKADVERSVSNFMGLISGKQKAYGTKVDWKCKNCEYREFCKA